MTKQSGPPQLNPGQFSVIFAEVKTGILVTIDGEYYTGQAAKWYEAFESAEDAARFAQGYVEKSPHLECTVRDHNGKPIKLFRKS